MWKIHDVDKVLWTAMWNAYDANIISHHTS